jgi:hypothetical protein
MNDEMDQSSGSGPVPSFEPIPAPAPAPGLKPAPTWTPDLEPAPTSSVEPAVVVAAATAPVDVRPGPRSSRARWAIAGLIALVIVALSAAGLFALAGASGSSLVEAWAPSDSMVYLEVRGDLPGDQRQNLGSFLAHFPGFADQSSLETKLDETFDRLVAKASSDKHDWTKEIKPWFGGQVGLSASGLPTAKGADAKSVRALLVASQKDPAAAMAWLKSISPATSADEPYQGLTLTVWHTKSGAAVAATATGGVLLLGDEASVKSAVDRGGKDGLATSQSFKTAMAALSGDQLTRMYLDTRAYVDAMKSLTDSLGAGAGLDATALAKLPDWLASGARFESDAISGELVAPLVDGATTVTDSESEIARHVPASTVVLLEAHDYGTLLQAFIAQLKKQPSYAAPLDQVEDAAKLVGGLDGAVGWIGDAGIVVTSDGKTPGGGLVIVPTDPAKADQFSTQVKNLLALAGTTASVIVKEEPYGSGTITTVDLGDINKLMGGGVAGPGSPLVGHAEISFTNQGGVVIIGAGPAWVKSIVDVKSGASLADQARYRDAMSRVGTSNASSAFLDLAAIRTLAEPLIKQIPNSKYATDIQPYLAPFDILAGASSTKGDTGRIKYVLTVIKPQ